MQIHGPDAIVKHIKVEPYGTRGHAALAFGGGIYLIMQSAEDCARLITAAAEARTLITAAEGEQP